MANHNTHALCTIPFDDLIVEADIIKMFGKIRLAHSKSYNPLTWIGLSEWFFKLIGKPNKGWSGRWHGTLDEYLKKCEKYGIKYVQIDLKDYVDPYYINRNLTKYRGRIKFYYSGIGKSTSFQKFADQNEITSIDLY
jgi:hypothetical protein